jgi:hypothetical protein
MAQRLYQERFPNRRLPHHCSFASINRWLRETGLLNVNRYDCGGGRTVRIPRFEEAVLNMVADTPSSSTRLNGHPMHASYTTVRQVVHQQQLHPYHRQKVQEMGPADYPRRQEFSQWFLQRCAAEHRFPSIVLYTDKKSFTRESIINSHKDHVWVDENSHATLEQGHQQRFSISVWCGIVHDPLIGPYVLPARLIGPVYRDFLWISQCQNCWRMCRYTFVEGCVSCTTGLKLISACMHENT